MADVVSPKKRSEMMAGIGGKNTKPEILVRKLLHRSGFRFSLHRKDLPGKPDIVLPKWNTVIFVHGCFWHGHDNCPLFRLPKSRQKFWADKIGSNQKRDEKVREAYVGTKWRVLEIWECATKGRTKFTTDELSAKLSHAIKFETKRESYISGSHPIIA